MRVLPDGGHAHQRGGHRERASLGHRARSEERRGALHRQGRVSHQRHGHLQGPDGEGGHRQGSRAGRGCGDDHLLHALRQRDGQPRQRDTAVGGADDGGQAHNHNGPEHDPVHDDAGRCRGPRDIRLRTRPQRAGPEGDIREGRPQIRRDRSEDHRHPPRREALRDTGDQGGDGPRRRHGELLPHPVRHARPELRQVLQGGQRGRLPHRGLPQPQHAQA